MERLNIETKVRSLQNILNDIRSGLIHIPSFQRDYVWNKDDIKGLFDSIKRKYPIGAVLFWSPDNSLGGYKKKIGSYYIQNTSSNATYILDGYQRLSTLFGCLTNPERISLSRDFDEWEEYFNLYYDLEEESFMYLRSSPKVCQIPVYILMNSSDFRKYARNHFETIDNEELISSYYDKADELSRSLSDYQIAVVDINNATIEEAVEIFSRVNSKGQDISLDWMTNALSYSPDFSFKEVIENLLYDLKIYNFDTIDRNLLFRCIQSSFGSLYIDNTDIEFLAKRSDFKKITLEVVSFIAKAVKFLYEDLLVVDPKLLPYNIQLIFIMEFFRRIPEPSKNQIEDLKRWFWFSSYSNYFTLYSLSNQRKAYNQFVNYLFGLEDEILFLDSNIKFSTAPFPDKFNMGSVRSKTLILFMLNYNHGFIPLENNNVSGFTILSVFPKVSKTVKNSMPVLKDGQVFYNNGNNTIISQLELNDLFGETINPDEYFLGNEESDLLFNFNEFDIDNVLLNRKRLIMDREKEFVNELDLQYFESIV